jgi:hypothetical protein
MINYRSSLRFVPFRYNDFWPSYDPWTLKFGQICSCHHFFSLSLEILTWFLVYECIMMSYRSSLHFVPVQWFFAEMAHGLWNLAKYLVVTTLLYPRSPKGEGGILFYSVHRRIFLSNCWWQKSDFWSQASYRYTILWVAFLDPSDSYFLFADFVDFYTHWKYMLIFRHIFSQQLLMAEIWYLVTGFI